MRGGPPFPSLMVQITCGMFFFRDKVAHEPSALLRFHLQLHVVGATLLVNANNVGPITRRTLMTSSRSSYHTYRLRISKEK